MAIIRADDVRKLTKEERAKRMGELKLELAKMRAQLGVGGTPANPGRIGEIRKTIARMLTINNEKPIEAKTSKKEAKR